MKVPKGDDAVIILASVTMPVPIDTIARHAWFAVREDGSERWRKIEYGSFGPGPLETNHGDVDVHAIWRGERAKKGIACLEKWRGAADIKSYLAYPGPNSNTFVDRLLRKCKLRASLPSTAIGKDYRGRFIGASWTSGGTGFQIETPLLGLRLGLTEGIEVHLLSLAFGIDLWPPALIVPFGQGRLGFADR
ncbi:MAG: DUF3750 domain-containing protein [Myxococcales bacterium]|nr:DUF3750 domain-containing protein [Myxococcales bacterium]